MTEKEELELRLEGKIALVTGAGRDKKGIGRAIALAMAKEGASVVIAEIDPIALLPSQTMYLEEGITFFEADVSDSTSVNYMVKRIVEKHGRIDILVNNAGIARDNLLVKMTDKEWDDVLKVNLTGAFYCTRAIARKMIAKRSGHIVNIASVIGEIGNVSQANYGASKAGVINLTKTAAKELARYGITVNAIAPGFIETAMTDNLSDAKKAETLASIPLGCFGKSDDVANMAVFLCTDDAKYITGQTINVDGGMVM